MKKLDGVPLSEGRITVFVEPELKAYLEQCAATNFRSLSAEVRMTLWQKLFTDIKDGEVIPPENQDEMEVVEVVKHPVQVEIRREGPYNLQGYDGYSGGVVEERADYQAGMGADR